MCGLILFVQPENIGVDARGVLKVFDFGLAKELKRRDLVQPPDGYRATGVTGSRRYMSPEVIKSQPYGFSADVYSFGVLLWEVMALRTPFCGLSREQHETKVAQAGYRPNVPRTWTEDMRTLVSACWADEPLERWDMVRICQSLQAQIAKAKIRTDDNDQENWHISTRTSYLSSVQTSS